MGKVFASRFDAPGKVIADALHMSNHTLRNHLASISSRLGVHTRLDLVMYALEHGLGKGRSPPGVK